jgi:hypothetical protein
LPEETTASIWAPDSLALEILSEIWRSLKEPVGFTVSFLSRRLPTSRWSASLGDTMRGVHPSPCDTTDALSLKGSRSK